MTNVNFAIMIDFAAGGLTLAAALIVWRRDLRAIVGLLAWQGCALAAIPIVRGLHDNDYALVAVGAAVQALLVALAVRDLGSCWIGSTIFAADLVRAELEVPDDWEPLGAIAIGHPAEPTTPRSPVPTDGLLVIR